MDTYDRQLAPLLIKLSTGPMSNDGLKEDLKGWYRHTYLQVACNRGYVEARTRMTSSKKKVTQYHLTKQGKVALQEAVQSRPPCFDEAVLEELQNRADIAGVDVRMTYVARSFSWTIKLTHPILDYPICSGWGYTNADAARICLDKTEQALPGAIEHIRQRIQAKLKCK